MSAAINPFVPALLPAYYANPFGFLGLIAVPAIVAIHMLREKSRRIAVSTLFLLKRLAPLTPRGRTMHMLQHSAALWLQLLIALVCTWLLAQPRWLRRDSSQRIAVILDDTASMSAFRPRIVSELPGALDTLSRGAAHTEWMVLGSGNPEAPLYRGADLQAAIASLDAWHPLLPYHDPARAFTAAQLQLRAGGSLFFVSDRQPEVLPAGIALLAYGEPIENCGFAGARTWADSEGAHWEALAKNSGATPQEREWWMETPSLRSQPQKIVLAPGEIATLPGPFPPGEKKVTIHLSPDRFTLDDTLPLIAPEPKKLTIFVHAPEPIAHFFQKIAAAIPGAELTLDAAQADLAVIPAAEASAPHAAMAIVLGQAGSPDLPAITGGIVAEKDPLTDGIVWEGLLSSGPGKSARAPSDHILVWQGADPLILIRTRASSMELRFNFDFEHSNAPRLPAFVIMATRFYEQAQRSKTTHFSDNFETNQVLPSFPEKCELVSDSSAKPATAMGGVFRAPINPGFFQVRQFGREVLAGSTHFGDPRESDFRLANSVSTQSIPPVVIQRENTAGDALAPLWLALLGAALAGSWWSQAK